MKKFYLFTKTLLVATVLLVGGANSAWAATVELLNTASWIHTHDGGSADRSSYLDFGVNSSITDNWTTSFDVTTTCTSPTYIRPGNYQIAITKDGTTYTDNTVVGISNVIFGVRYYTASQTNTTSLACTVTLNGEDIAGTTTLSHGTKYTFTVSVDGKTLTASITSGETEVYSGSTTMDAFVKPRGIYDLLPRPYSSTWGVYTNTYSDILVTKEAGAEEVTAPAIAVTGANGVKRTITITGGTSTFGNDVTTYYTTNGTDPTSSSSTYSAPFEVSSNCTVKAISISSTDLASNITSLEVTAGTTIDLLAATLTHSGASQYTISNNQSSLIGSPTATVHYQIDGGAEQTSTNTSVNVTVTADGTLSYWLTADGYGATSKEDADVYVSVPLATVETVNFCTSNTNEFAKAGSVVAVSEDGEHTYYNYLTNNDVAVGAGVIATTFIGSAGASDAWRIQRYYGGTRPHNHDEIIVFLNVKAGQVVEVKCDQAPTIKANLTLLPGNTYTGTYSYTVNSDGNALLTLTKTTVITYAYVKQDHVTATIGSNGYATFCSEYPLDFTSVSNATAWVATACNGSKVTMTQVKGSIYQGKGLVLKSNSGAAAEVTIPVVASSTNYYDGNMLVACLEETTVTPSVTGTNYVLSVQGDEVVFAPVTSDDPNDNPTVGAGHAYLYVPDATARVISMVFGDEILTGINKIENGELNIENSLPVKRIINGKLVIEKNGMMFNANGQMVK